MTTKCEKQKEGRMRGAVGSMSINMLREHEVVPFLLIFFSG
jgi:hypothetical protein